MVTVILKEEFRNRLELWEDNKRNQGTPGSVERSRELGMHHRKVKLAVRIRVGASVSHAAADISIRSGERLSGKWLRAVSSAINHSNHRPLVSYSLITLRADSSWLESPTSASGKL